MKYAFSTSFGAIALFLVVIGVHADMLPGAAAVPYETGASVAQSLGLVRAGMSNDGQLRIEARGVVPYVAPRLKFSNHARTLRAFHALDNAGAPHLYVETSRPNHFYEISGDFILTDFSRPLSWEDNERLSFVGRADGGAEQKLTIDLEFGTLSVGPVDDPVHVSIQDTADFD